MFRMVVVDQLERGEANAGVRGRISGILGVARFGSGARPPHLLVVAAVAVLCALVVVGAVLDRAWLVSALLVAIVTLLLTAPSFFAHYAGYAAAPLLVLTGTGAAALTVRPVRLRSLAPGSRHALIVALAVAAIPITAFACVVAGLHRGTRFPGASLGKAAASSHCVTADSPAALIQMDLLSRDLERQCRVWIDVTGLTYDTAGLRRPNGEPLPRRLDRPWQRALMDYLLSGNAIVILRSGADGFAPENARTIDHLPVLARVAGHTLWQVPPGLQHHGGPLPPGKT
jgi:hypothetical protein